MLHLIHPAFVHFAVAFLILGGLTEAWGLAFAREGAARFGGGLVLVGTLALFPTIVTGYLAANSLDVPDAVRPLLDVHERVGLALLVVFMVSQLWKAWVQGSLPPGQRILFAIYLVAAVLLTAYGAILGGELIYGHGVGVIGD